MSRNDKISFEQKLQAIAEYFDEHLSQRLIAKKHGISVASFQTWLRKYSMTGAEGLQNSAKYKKYSAELKQTAVLDYLSGTASQEGICEKYRISSKTQLQRWIVWYNSHKEFKKNPKGDKHIMTKARKTTFDERIEIVKFCIGNNKDYGLTIEKFHVSYQQIYLWVRKYEEKGIDGLVDRRGMAKPESAITDVDKLKAQNKLLQVEKERLEMEVNVLKKLAEVERRRR